MPGTFSQIYTQIVFAVKGRENLKSNNWKLELHKYIAGIIKNKGQKTIIAFRMLCYNNVIPSGFQTNHNYILQSPSLISSQTATPPQNCYTRAPVPHG